MPVSNPSTLDLLRDRLQACRPPGDPTAVVLPPGSDRWPDDFRASLTRGLRPAGVLIPLIERQGGPVVLLTQRAAVLRQHARQIAFPGGGMESVDGNIVDTALRETHEEVGILPTEVTVFGCLEPMPTVSGFAVTPVVGQVDTGATIVIDTAEVESAFEVPLDFLLDPGNARLARREVRGHEVDVVEYRYGPHRIWGATAHMLVRLREVLE